jgi:hypothetical protein
MAALVEAGGSPLGSFPLTVPSDGLAHHRPAIAAGDSALVVWQDAPSDPEDLNLYVFRLTADLHYLDPPTGTPLVTAPGNQTNAAVAWDGERFTTAFVDDRNSVNLLDTRTDVDWNWISASGPVADPSGATAFAASVPEFAPAVAGEGGSPLIAASVFSPAPPHAAYRIEVRFAAQISGVPGGNGVVPGLVRLLSAYPNPANPSVEIRFSLARESDARVEIYDLQGARINTLRAGRLPAGLHELHWDGRDASGQAAPSGTYLFLLRAGNARQSGKLTLVR